MAVLFILLLLSVCHGLQAESENNNAADSDSKCPHGYEVMSENQCDEEVSKAFGGVCCQILESGKSTVEHGSKPNDPDSSDSDSSTTTETPESGSPDSSSPVDSRMGSSRPSTPSGPSSTRVRRPNVFALKRRRQQISAAAAKGKKPLRPGKKPLKPGKRRMVKKRKGKKLMGKRPRLSAESGPSEYGPDQPQAYMDYYDPRYEQVYGSGISDRAKNLLENYKYHGECGARFESVKTIGRISSGYQLDLNVAGFAEFPWMAAVLVKEDFHKPQVYGSATELVKFRDRARFRCGATIINEQHVVTAAHCVYGQKKDRLIIRAGEWNLMGSTGEMYPSIDRYVEDLILHKGYNPANYDRDIALIKLDRPIDFNFTPHIRPVCLPPLGSKPFDGHMKCYIAGWGEDVYKPNFGSNVLKIISVTLNDDEDECRAKLYSAFGDGIVDSEYNTDEDYQKCIVGTEGRDACVGDGGGAVVCPLDLGTDCGPYGCEYSEHYFMAGIISFGPPTCGDKEITMITDILPHMSWLQTLLNKY